VKVCVYGLWHLGTVTAACLAAGRHEVVGLDPNARTIEDLQAGRPPLFEPGLEDLVAKELANGSLKFTTDAQRAVQGAEVVWVAFDTPVDDEDRADVEYVFQQVEKIFPHLSPGSLVLISSQLPVGSTRRVEQAYASAFPDTSVTFAYSPENLRLGKAIAAFMNPERVVAGLRSASDRDRLAELFRPFTERIEWMSVESAEMTKHALNAFLAVSVTFANEIATLCERVGADAKEVERGLKSEGRIGQKAYLAPGGAFAGGTLARDVTFLTHVGARDGRATPLLSAVITSNDEHRLWVRRTLVRLFGSVDGRCIAVWGLTYKPGTDTLRRSDSVALCTWLAEHGACVQTHDPAVTTLPDDLAHRVTLCRTPLEAARGASALVVATEWPEYAALSADPILTAMREPVVVDPNRFLAGQFRGSRATYVAVGAPDVLP
jgi:UDPglucose 6-dehydrogenase